MNRNITLQLISGTSQFDREKNYWLNKFAGEIVKSSLYYDRTWKDERDFSSETIKFTFSQELFSKLNHLSNRSDNNLFLFLTTAISILLHRYTANDDIIVGCPILKQETEGNFLNTMLALRNGLTPGISFKELLLQVKQTFNEANDNSNYPIQRLLYYLGLPQDESGFPLFETIIMLENIHERKYTANMNHNMVWVFRRDDQRIDGALEYNAALFQHETAERLASHLVNILENCLENINIPLPGIEILSGQERHLLLEEFNGTDTAFPGDKVYHELFEEQAAKTPDHIASGGQGALLKNRPPGTDSKKIFNYLTYRQLNDASNRLARFLTQKRVGPDIIVAIMTPPSLEMVVGIMSILKAGGAYLPIDHEAPHDRIEYLLNESHCHFLLTPTSLGKKVNIAAEKINIDDESLYTGDPSNLERISSPGNLFYTIYTSGTTGRPKGALLTHRNIVNYVTWFCQIAELTDQDRTVMVSSFAFDIGYTTFLSSLVTGGRLYLATKETYIDGGALLDYIKENSISYIKMTPSLFSVLVSSPRFSGGMCETLRLMVLGGEAINVHDVEELHRECSHLRVINHYGPTETTIGCVARYIDFEHFEGFKKLPTIGKPINNVRVYILDGYLRLLPVRVLGELYIGGQGVARGYLNNPELTAEKFDQYLWDEKGGQDKKKNEDYQKFFRGSRGAILQKSPPCCYRFYKTGDQARWLENGNIEFLGRIDQQVKIRGFRIELGEIEAHLTSHPQVKEALVLSHKESNNDNYLCAYIVPGNHWNPAELREYLARDLSDFMIPSHFMRLEKIPLTPNGKLDRKALPKPELKAGESYTAPRDEIETKLVGLWSEILIGDELQASQLHKIGIDDNFFQLGGHSLKATILASRIEKAFNVKIPLVEIFASPRIRELSGYIRNAAQWEYQQVALAEKKEYYVLSSAQKRLHFLQQMDKDSTAYNIPSIMILEGIVDKDRLEQSVLKVIKRHESLRTSFHLVNDEPVQRIHDEVEFEIEYKDLAPTDKHGQTQTSLAEKVTGNTGGKDHHSSFIIQHFIRAFDLSKMPLLRVGLVKLAEARHIFLVDMHHIISDGLSSRVLVQDFSALFLGNELSEIKLQYKDYAEWQNMEKVSKKILEQGEYWKKEFEGEIPILELPTDYARPVVQNFEGNHLTFEIINKTTESLKAMARDAELTLYILLLSLYTILLSKLSSQEDIVVGTPVAGRRHTDLEKIIGMFVNTLALRNYPTGEKKFMDFLMEVKKTTLDGFENQEYQFEDFVEQISLNRDVSRNPLFDTLCVLQNIGSQKADIPGLKLFPYIYENKTSKFDLALNAVEEEGKLLFIFEYSTKLFREETIKRFIACFKNIVNGVIENNNRKIADYEIITEEEKKKILFDFNETQAEYPKNKTIHQLFEEQVCRTPDNLALVFKDNEITYRHLNEQANRLGRLLMNEGVRPDVLVSLMVQRSAEMVVGIWGILKSGGAYLPINPEAPEDRIIYMLDNASVNVILTQEKFIKKFANRYKVINLNSPVSYKNSSSNPQCKTVPMDLAYVIYTSGSAGKPKGVMIQNRSVINIVKWFAAQYNLKPGFQLLQMFEFTFDASINQIFGSMLHGVTLHVIRKDYFFDIEFLRDYIITRFINLINFVQSVIKEVLCGKEKIESLKYVISGAEKLKSTIKNEILDNGYALYNQYGPTEVTVDALAEKCSYESNGTVGVPVYNAQCYIVNPYGQLNPLGVAGELWVSGDGLARGYINNVELTAEKFTAISIISQMKVRVYRTGDLTRWLPAGNVEFLGRIDTQVKIRGFRIEPVEIANQLVKIAGIKEAVVIDREDTSGETYLCAYLVGEEETEELKNSEIKDILSRSLPDYMIPAYFVWIERLPLSGHGKLIRSALPEPDMTMDESYVPPSNQLEKKLASIWSEVLNIDMQIISIHSDFFQLGGHSLKATILVAKIHKELNTKIPLAVVFQKPTISELAGYIESNKKEKYTALEAVEEKEYYALSSAQKRLYILQQMVKDITVYNLSNVIPLGNHIEKEKLESVFKKLIKRHESLRTNFITVADEPVQKINKAVDFSIHCSTVSELEIEANIGNYVRPFDLSKAPLLRVDLLTVSPAQQILFVDMHHIITDGVSHAILRKEFADLYSGNELAPLRLQYKDYSEWQNSNRQKQLIKEQEQYWSEIFADEVPVLNLPTDFPRPIVQSFNGNQVDFLLTVEESQVLKKLAKQTGATLYMCVLSVFAILLSRLSGQEDIVIGMPIAARKHADLEKIIGMFVNTLVIRSTPNGEKSYHQFLMEMKECTLKAYENQEYQFEELIDKLSLTRDPGRNPLFDVALNLLNMEANKEYMPNAQEQEQILYKHRKSTSKFDLILTLMEFTDNLLFTFEYCTQLFKPGTIERFISYFKGIINSLADNWDQELSGLKLINEEERCRILYEFNNTKCEYPKNKTVVQLFEEQISRTPNNIALVGAGEGEAKKRRREEEKSSGVETLRATSLPSLQYHQPSLQYNHPSLQYQQYQTTYSHLNEQSNKLAGWLLEKSVLPDTIVAIMMERSVEMITGIFGILKSGCAYLPIDPSYPQERIDYMLKDSGAKLLVITSDIEGEKVRRWEGEKVLLEQISRFPKISYYPITLLPAYPLNPQNIAYVIYTSGTTGQPKGSLIEHGNVVRLMFNEKFQFDFSASNTWTLFHSFCFDFSVWEMYGALLYGAKLIIVPKNLARDTVMFLELLNKEQVTVLNQTPSAFYNLSHEALSSAPQEKKLSIKYIIFGGEALNPLKLKDWHREYPLTRFINMFGITETTVHVTYKEINYAEIEADISNIGRPIPTLYIYLLDQYLKPVPVGVPGEICVGGKGVCRGYLNRIELTSRKFIQDPFKPGDRLYHSGDLGRLMKNGDLEYLGRIDQQVKIRGFRIELGEIENRLIKYPGLKDVVVINRQEDNEDKYLCAYFVANEEILIPGLREFLTFELPDYMIPSYFVRVERIPLTVNGKVDRKALPKPGINVGDSYTAPRDDIEKKLVVLWCEVLGRDEVHAMALEKSIGIDDNFFHLGGHSLKAIILAAKIRKNFDVSFSLIEIFRAPTIKTISSLLKIINPDKNKKIDADQKMEEITI